MKNLFLAKSLIKKLCEHSCWKIANEKQKESMDVLIARTNLTKFIFPINRDMQVNIQSPVNSRKILFLQ